MTGTHVRSIILYHGCQVLYIVGVNKMYQYYVMEIQKYQNGEYGDQKHFVYDEDATKARLKGESKYYEVLSAAAVSTV